MHSEKKLDDAQIRVLSVTVEQLAHNIQSQALLLREAFMDLYPNLQFADPVKDAAFDRYMHAMAYAKLLCDQMPSLAHQAREMQGFGKQKIVADVSNLSRHVENHVATCPEEGRRGLTPAHTATAVVLA